MASLENIFAFLRHALCIIGNPYSQVGNYLGLILRRKIDLFGSQLLGPLLDVLEPIAHVVFY